jgi:hypothetical protein
LVAASFQGIPSAHADWANFGTVSMTDATHPKLTNGYGCYTDGRDIICDGAASAVSFGSGGLISYGGMTVVGTVSASAISSTYVSTTVLQINPSSMPCLSGLNGTIRYSNTSNTLEVCTGTTWSTLSSNTTPGNVAGNGSATSVAFWNGPNSLTYESDTTSGLYWDAVNKRLGIGTNSPTRALTVNAEATSANGIYVYGTWAPAITISSTTGEAVLGVASNNGHFSNRAQANDTILRSKWGNLWLTTFSPTDVVIAPSDTEIARFKTGGNVGIGTQSPTATLQVSGSAGGGVASFVNNSSAYPYLRIGEFLAPSLQSGQQGYINIGAANSTLNSVALGMVNAGPGSLQNRLDFTFYGAQTPFFSGLASGNVGIGLVTPTTSLQVSGTATMNMANLVSQSTPALMGAGGNMIVSGSASVVASNNGLVTVAGTLITTGAIGAVNQVSLTGHYPYLYLNDIDVGSYWQFGNGDGTLQAIYNGSSTLLRLSSTGTLTIYGSSTCTIGNGTGNTACTSDRRLKQNIRPITSALQKLELLNGITYHWKDPSKSKPEHIGLIAQDVEKVFPQAVDQVSNTTLGTAKTVDYAVLIAPAIEAIKELKADNDTLRTRIDQLKAANDNAASLRSEMDELRAELRNVKAATSKK